MVERYFTPDLIILGGGVSKELPRYVKYLQARAPIVPAAMLNTSGIVGAAMAAHGGCRRRRPTTEAADRAAEHAQHDVVPAVGGRGTRLMDVASSRATSGPRQRRAGLAREHCQPVRAGTSALSHFDIEELADELEPGWRVNDDLIRREYVTNDFGERFALATRIALLAEGPGPPPGADGELGPPPW